MKLLATLFLVSASLVCNAQAVPSATAARYSLTAGITGSVFQPYNGLYTESSTVSYWSSHRALMGAGVFLDLRLSRRLRLEVEAHNLESNKFKGRNGFPSALFSTEHPMGENMFMAGPLAPLHRFGRATPFAKALVGVGYTTGDANYKQKGGSLLAEDYGNPSVGLAFSLGGGVDYRLTRRFSLRALDFEWMQWSEPIHTDNWTAVHNFSIHPTGVSSGISYRIF